MIIAVRLCSRKSKLTVVSYLNTRFDMFIPIFKVAKNTNGIKKSFMPFVTKTHAKMEILTLIRIERKEVLLFSLRNSLCSTPLFCNNNNCIV